MIVNFNVGLLGHVDSGKTTLARTISSIASTAAFDKNPQSKERGITLDLGFSAALIAAPTQLKAVAPEATQVLVTFVDCPGHASLIRTIIGGAQIIDLMLLVIDAQRGIQTQTAECIVIGELLRRQLIVVVNKIDLLDAASRDAQLEKLNAKLRKTLAKTAFGADVPVFNVSAQSSINLQELIAGIAAQISLPKRNIAAPLLMYVDHCFSVKGQGTVCTGTVVQGTVTVNEAVEIPLIREQRKVKSIQMFRQPVQSAAAGDRVGLCVTQFNAKLLERGVITQPGYLHPVYAACIRVERIQYYKQPIKSRSKLHISTGHDTVMASITLFRAVEHSDRSEIFDTRQEYEFIEELECQTDVATTASGALFALLEFETSILAAADAILIASKLDMNVHSNSCRLAFWGCIQWLTHSTSYTSEQLPTFKIFKRKSKCGSVQRLVSESQLIVQNLFKKEANRSLYVGKTVELSTGEAGIIESTFGQGAKVKVHFRDGLKADTLQALTSGRIGEISVYLKCKKYIFNKNLGLVQ